MRTLLELMENKKLMHQPIICFVAGRSGGHIIPALTLAQQEYAKYDFMFLSSDVQLDKDMLASTPHHIPLTLGNIPYKKPWLLPQFIYQLAKAICTSVYHLHKHKPKKVISTGGYIALPVCLAATLLRIPIELFELNVIPGKATKVLAPLATSISICFEESKQYLPQKKCVYKPYPVRFPPEDKKITPTSARENLNLGPHKKTIFILGGSQGSLFINNLFKQWLKHNKQLHNTIQVIHQTGVNDPTDWQQLYQQYNIPACVFAYNNNIKYCYAAANLIICRSGAGTLFEILFFETPCITIPLETATTNHQIANACALEKRYPHLFTMIQQHTIAKNPALVETIINEKTSIASHNKTSPKYKQPEP